MVELMFRSCWLLSYVDYGDIWLYVPTLHKVVFKLSNQHYQQDYLVLINHLDRVLFLLEVISLELSLDFTYLRQVLIQLPSRFWIFSDLIHLFSIISNEIESDSRFIKVSIENIIPTRIYFTEFQRQTKPLLDLGPSVHSFYSATMCTCWKTLSVTKPLNIF